MTVTIDATPTAVDLCVYRGDDFFLRVSVSALTGDPADLTGCVPMAQVRASADDPAVLATFACVITDNVVDLHLAAADTAALPTYAVWDVQLTYPDTTVATLAAGAVRLYGEVTRDGSAT
jgi:hypothetical protein